MEILRERESKDIPKETLVFLKIYLKSQRRTQVKTSKES